VNHRRPWWIVFSLLPPLIALCGLIIPSGCGGGGGGSFPTAVPTTGAVAVALVGSPPPGNFRSVLLNIAGIRINQTFDASTSAPGWVKISVPPQAGAGNGQSPGDLQLDLLQTQTGAVVFNVGGAPAGTYQTVQVLIDSNKPGTIVPACQSGASNTEGCTKYPMHFNGFVPVIFSPQEPISVTNNATSPLVIQLGVSITQVPVNSGDPFEVTFTAAEVPAAGFLAQVSGNVTVKGATGGSHLIPLTVSAELTGTNNIIETAIVRAKGAYSLELPAAPSGTSYDIFTNGGGGQYTAVQGVTVIPQQAALEENLTVQGASAAGLSGFIGDACTGLGIPGAQLEILAPPPSATPRPTPPVSLSLCLDHPEQCVVVASSTTDQTGNYPLPGNAANPAGLSEVPINQRDLALRISSTGYSTLDSSLLVKTSHNAVCSASPFPQTACNFALTTGLVNGTVNLVTDPPPGNSVVVQVLAENSGTNQLVSALPQPLVFGNHQSSLPFTLNVPITGAGPNFDLFAVAIDPFLGGPAPFPGHDIPVLANLTGPTVGCTAGQVNIPALPLMNCVGHGSITGTVQNPDLGTFVEVEKQGVQILGTPPGLFSSSSPSNNAYSLCVPPDNYALQRFEAPTVVPGVPTSTPTAVGNPQNIMVPAPAATSSPCPSTCSNTDTGPEPCPGICTSTNASPL
jgi:hypothetical protein